MNDFLAVIALLAILTLLGFILTVSGERRDARCSQLRQVLADYHEQNLATASSLRVFCQQYAEDVKYATDREPTSLQAVLDALTTDRQRLVTAVLAIRDVNAARTLGVVDQATGRANDAAHLDAALRRLHQDDEQAGRTNDLVDTEGNPIMPVGMSQ